MRFAVLPMLSVAVPACTSRMAVVTSEMRPPAAAASATPRARGAVIEPSSLWMTVAPIGLLMVPFRMMSSSDGALLRICTSVGSTVRSIWNSSDTFGPFKSTRGWPRVLTTSMLLIFSGRSHSLVIKTWRKVSLKSQVPSLPRMASVPVRATLSLRLSSVVLTWSLK